MAEEPAPVGNGHVEQPDAAAYGPGKKSKADKKKEKKQKQKQNRQQRRCMLGFAAATAAIAERADACRARCFGAAVDG
jgi:hypothetical protein